MNFEAVLFFPSATVASIYSYSHGIPRLINTICENTLIHAYAQQSKTVTEDMVHEVARDLRLRVTSLPLVSGNASTSGQESIAKSLLDLANMLERAALGSLAHSPASGPVTPDVAEAKIARRHPIRRKESPSGAPQ